MVLLPSIRKRGEDMKKIKTQIWMGILCIILGLMISLQFKYVNNPKNTVNTRRVEDLVKEVEGLKVQRDELQKKVGDAEKKLNELESSYANSSEFAAKLKEDIDLYRKLAGATDVEGEGIMITINMPVDLDPTQSEGMSDTTLVTIVNELNSAQAEAISINGERITARSSIRSAGNAIKINANPFDPYKQFTIYAIGNPADLESALTITGGVVDALKEMDISVKITKENKINILGSKKVFEPKYIK